MEVAHQKSAINEKGYMKGYLQLAIYANYGMLTVHVVQAKSLKAATSTTCNTFVRVCLSPDEDRRTWCKTTVVKETNSPVFDEKFSFELMDEDYRKRLSLSLWHMEPKQSTSEFLGSMSFGLKHICQQKKKINGWYHLLGEELGNKKHLHVTMVSRKKPLLAERDINSIPLKQSQSNSLSQMGPSSSKSSSQMGPPQSRSSSQMGPPQSRSSSQMGLSQPRSWSHMGPPQSRGLTQMGSHRSKGSSRMGPPQMGPPQMVPPQSKMATKMNLVQRSRSMNRHGLNASQLNSSHLSVARMNSSHLSSSQMSVADIDVSPNNSFNNSMDEDNDENVWTDTITVVVRRGVHGFGFSISGGQPVQACSIEPGSTADVAGLRNNDQLMKINGVSVINASTQEVAVLVRQKHCSKLILEVQRPYTHTDLMNMSTMSRMSSCSLASRVSSYSFSLSRQDSCSSLASHASSVKLQDKKQSKRRKLRHIASSMLGGLGIRR